MKLTLFRRAQNCAKVLEDLVIYNELQGNERHGQHSRPLDFSITENEVRKAANKLKNSKSPFSDKIRNEKINAGLDTLMPVYDKLFNPILPLGTMPPS